MSSQGVVARPQPSLFDTRAQVPSKLLSLGGGYIIRLALNLSEMELMSLQR